MNSNASSLRSLDSSTPTLVSSSSEPRPSGGKWTFDRVVGALGRDRLGDVVVVDQADVDLAVGDRVADRDVVGEGDRVVGDHALEPLARDVLAVARAAAR